MSDFWLIFYLSNFLQIYFLCFWFTRMCKYLSDSFDRFDIYSYIFVSMYVWYDPTLTVIFNVFILYVLYLCSLDLDVVVVCVLFLCLFLCLFCCIIIIIINLTVIIMNNININHCFCNKKCNYNFYCIFILYLFSSSSFSFIPKDIFCLIWFIFFLL